MRVFLIVPFTPLVKTGSVLVESRLGRHRLAIQVPKFLITTPCRLNTSPAVVVLPVYRAKLCNMPLLKNLMFPKNVIRAAIIIKYGGVRGQSNGAPAQTKVPACS